MGSPAEPGSFDLRRVSGALLVSAFGLLLMLAAWRAGPPQWRAARRLPTLSATAHGEVDALWWHLDFDPRPLGRDGTNWLALTAPELCTRLRFRPAATGRSTAIEVAYDPADPRRAAPAAWRRDPLLHSPIERIFPVLAFVAGLVA